MAVTHENGGSSAPRSSLAALIDERARRNADAPYLLDARSERRVSYGDLASSAASWRDVVAPERVGLLVADPLTFARHFLSLVSAGCWVSPLDPTEPRLDASRARAVIAQRRLVRVYSDREAPPGRRELDGAVGLVEGEPPIGQPLDARRDGSCGHAEGLRERAGVCATVLAEPPDRFQRLAL